MIKRTRWDVLVVDDEPDVLAVTRLALKHIQVYGIPLKIHECTNQADAINYLQATAELSDLSLAIIDVVMETDRAGLDVCKFIREDLNNRVTPIVVRTGQPGKAPEREVVERYDISTYLSKAEATNEKLHATVVNAVRNYELSRFFEGFFMYMGEFMPRCETHAGIQRAVPEVMRALLSRRDGTPLEYFDANFCLLYGEEAIPYGGFVGRENEARAMRDRLVKEPSHVINPRGDRFMRMGDQTLISVAGIDKVPAIDMIGETNYRPMPDYTVRIFATWIRLVRDLIIWADKRH